ncbi:MAG: aminopeptidase P family protein, partial [Pseudomonadota bacterium]
MTSDIDRQRAEKVLEAAGLDALVIAEPEGFATVTGASPGVPSLFRRAGAALALLPADPALSLGAVATDLAVQGLASQGVDTISHLSWVDVADFPEGSLEDAVAATIGRRGADFRRPTTFDPEQAFADLADLLFARGLHKARIGLDL